MLGQEGVSLSSRSPFFLCGISDSFALLAYATMRCEYGAIGMELCWILYNLYCVSLGASITLGALAGLSLPRVCGVACPRHIDGVMGLIAS
jgi:hypothetical protein